jgi:flagellar basal-body rod modification protein FlgD
MQTTATSGSTPTSVTQTQRTQLATDFNGFLKLLTTQLQNQDPLSPMDADKFTSQLVQFASVEQALATNTKLDKLSSVFEVGSRAAALNYLGTEVELEGGLLKLDGNGGARIRYELDREAADVFVRFYDATGNLLHVDSGGLAKGANEFAWNGRLSDGRIAEAGAYRVEVSARDTGGRTVPVKLTTTGRVEAVTLGESGPSLTVNGAAVPLSAIRSITQRSLQDS